MSEPREWELRGRGNQHNDWIEAKLLNGNGGWNDLLLREPVVVIEKSAYDQLRAENERLKRELELAIAHDRQSYPTAWAYEQLGKSLEKANAENEKLKALVGELYNELGVIGGMTTDEKTREFINRDGGVCDKAKAEGD